jgi:GNAT superfamily N-acetyltransferase
MPTFQYDPPLPPLGNNDGLLQTVRLIEGCDTLATAIWHSAPDDTDGIVQLIDFRVVPTEGRRGHGKRLLTALIDQCLQYHRLRGRPLRRLWMPLHHKRHVIARAFFLSQGFTHTITLKDLAIDQELLVYVRTFD